MAVLPVAGTGFTATFGDMGDFGAGIVFVVPGFAVFCATLLAGADFTALTGFAVFTGAGLTADVTADDLAGVAGEVPLTSVAFEAAFELAGFCCPVVLGLFFVLLVVFGFCPQAVPVATIANNKIPVVSFMGPSYLAACAGWTGRPGAAAGGCKS